jgi:hypothetical protein
VRRVRSGHLLRRLSFGNKGCVVFASRDEVGWDFQVEGRYLDFDLSPSAVGGVEGYEILAEFLWFSFFFLMDIFSLDSSRTVMDKFLSFLGHSRFGQFFYYGLSVDMDYFSLFFPIDFPFPIRRDGWRRC